ncbi:hypothetical protein [Streptomyces poriferorum]|uniref:Uncharacterized protein n=1 Tax=Streptomyces poriferorum TaxID=2798799 RepID=A0ABY9J093_9ACTN|nr:MULTISPECIES: hypothetical protein [unclassified Streptomyces]MDP5310392.1 hypothetical protein [Streptomyces sp. Alt4]WLQ60454.1 hypothetical protein P8A19_35745 [Streptomyces sp. Alt2]
MARYEIHYLDGNTDHVTADGVEYDTDARDYTFFTDGQVVALTPVANVRSIIRHEDQAVTG